MATLETPGLQLDVLEALAETPPTHLVQPVGPDGQTKLRFLYAQAAAADLVPQTAADDIGRLHSLFDVALDHGLGGLILDYIAEVCSDRSLTSSDPLQAFLMDVDCVRRWVQKLLSVARGRLAAWLSRGLGFAGSAELLSKELGRLQALLLVAQALGSPGGAAAAEPTEVASLARCAAALAWLGARPGALGRAAGRYQSEQEWRSAAAKRREGAAALGAAVGGGAAGGLFLDDLLAELAAVGLEGLAYPPPSPDRLLAALFLAPSGAASAARGAGAPSSAPQQRAAGGDGVHARLALLAYYLADGGFLGADAIVAGLRTHFGVAPPAAAAWLLQQRLDEAAAPGPGGAAALHRAAELLPAVEGAALPRQAMEVFAARGRPDVALSLLRQRPEADADLEEAAAALRVRCQAGLLAEAFLGVKRATAAAAAAAGPGGAAAARRTAAARLLPLLLGAAARVRAPGGATAVHAVARLPFDGAEEQEVLGWLEREAAEGQAYAALMIPLYHLLRGRTPQALLEYSRRCPAAPTSPQQADLAALLAAAAGALPAPQRALAVATAPGAAPALLPATEQDAARGAAGVRLMEKVAEVARAELAPAMLAVGPTPTEAPLVGSVPALLERQREASAAAAAREAAPTQAQQAREAPVSLFGQPAAGAAHASEARAGAGGVFGAAGDDADAEAAAGVPAGSWAAAAGPAHEFDRVLGLAAPGGTPGGRGKRRYFGGGARR